MSTAPEPGPSPWPDLAALTGVRSGKGSFYPEYRGVTERLERVVHALETISRALVRTVEGPETLVRAVVEAAGEHLSAEWVVFALADGALPEARPRQLVLGPDGCPHPPDVALPAPVLAHLAGTRQGGLVHHDEGPAHHTHVPIVLDGGVVGAFVAWTPAERAIDATDTAVLTILASQTAVALQNSALFTSSRSLLERSEHAYAESTRHAAALSMRAGSVRASLRCAPAGTRRWRPTWPARRWWPTSPLAAEFDASVQRLRAHRPLPRVRAGAQPWPTPRCAVGRARTTPRPADPTGCSPDTLAGGDAAAPPRTSPRRVSTPTPRWCPPTPSARRA